MAKFTTIHSESGKLYSAAEQRQFQERDKPVADTKDLNRSTNHERAISQAFERWKAPGGGALTADERIEITGNARAAAYRDSLAKGKGIPQDHEVKALVDRALNEAINSKLEEDNG